MARRVTGHRAITGAGGATGDTGPQGNTGAASTAPDPVVAAVVVRQRRDLIYHV
jgi:hypothetical protein